MSVTRFNFDLIDELHPKSEAWLKSCRNYLVWGQYRRDYEAAETACKKDDSWLLAVPFDGAGTVTSFTTFGLDPGTTTFRTSWEVEFDRAAGAPSAHAFFMGHLRYADSGGTGTATLRAAWRHETPSMQRAGVAYKEPAWSRSLWPEQAVYVGLDTADMRTQVTTYVERQFPNSDPNWKATMQRRLWQRSWGGALKQADAEALTTYAKLRDAIVDGVMAGNFTRLQVFAGDKLAEIALPTSGPRTLSFYLRSLEWDDGAGIDVRCDPAYYISQHTDRTHGLSSSGAAHANATSFWDHRGVVMALHDSASGYGVVEEVTSSQTLQDAIDALSSSKFGTVVLKAGDWIADAPSSSHEYSMIKLSVPVNIVGDSRWRMLRTTYRDVDGNNLEGSATTVLDKARSTNPAPGKHRDDLHMDDDGDEYETRVIEVIVGSTVTWQVSDLHDATGSPSAVQPWQGTIEYTLTRTGSAKQLPVLEGDASETGTQRYRCLLIDVSNEDIGNGVISIANIAFLNGGVKVQSGSDAEGMGGGGICVDGTDKLRISNCAFVECGAAWRSGGNSWKSLYDGAGGGIFCLGASPIVEGCYFRGRRELASYSGNVNKYLLSNTGDGLAAWALSFPVIQDCAFFANRARAQSQLEVLTHPYPHSFKDSFDDAPEETEWTAFYNLHTISHTRTVEKNLGIVPLRVIRCLLECGRAEAPEQNNAGFYASAGASVIMLETTVRHAASDYGANAWVSFGSELVVSGCDISCGRAEHSDGAAAWDTGGLGCRNSDAILVPSLRDKTVWSTIASNEASDGRGAGVKVVARPNGTDPQFNTLLQLFWKRRQEGPREHPVNPHTWVVGVDDVETRLICAGVTFEGNEALSTSYGRGGAILALNTPETFTTLDAKLRIRLIGSATELLVKLKSSNAAGLTSPGGGSTDLYYLVDNSSGTERDDTDLTVVAGDLTLDESYDS